jgi:hypothetical protein
MESKEVPTTVQIIGTMEMINWLKNLADFKEALHE